ncbi:MBL fold metallo-hydrolase [Cryobacterium frigoriphilum]|uniref:MBL fold metallo-hydrolase n=1 Tax=Cryobacterium frigoriphilum TaxID=1259150 RepID=A0A4R8ZV98_9MICO|nr:MBL fold metallo-hydrolase [Cryobacterium frigoriphilum]TFD46966.1 MBL fold metallo-hydrolase [Cryobacterium frigoriphilum]
MHATSAAQFASSTTRIAPDLEQVRDDVWALGMPMPGGHIPYSLLYLLRDSADGIHVIDPGWDSKSNLQRVLRALASLGAAATDIRSITATHLHPDHIGMGPRLKQASGAPLQVHATEKEALYARGVGGWSPSVFSHVLDDWGVPANRRAEIEAILSATPPHPDVHVDRVLANNERLDIPGFDLVAMLTPGHTPGHLSLRDDARSIMFTGDHLLPTMHAGLGLGGPTNTNALTDYLDSLDTVSVYPDHEALPGHGYRFSGLAKRAGKSARHHLKRSREVAEVVADSPDSTIWQIAERLTWTAGWNRLEGFFLFSALSQTAIHRDFVAADGLARIAAHHR